MNADWRLSFLKRPYEVTSNDEGVHWKPWVNLGGGIQSALEHLKRTFKDLSTKLGLHVLSETMARGATTGGVLKVFRGLGTQPFVLATQGLLEAGPHNSQAPEKLHSFPRATATSRKPYMIHR